jgi:tRNA G10  N-methylase Trm11
MTELITTSLILDTLKGWVEGKHPIDAHKWVDAAQKLNVLIGDEHDKLFDLQQKVAQMKVNYLTEGNTSAAAKSKVEATDLYREMRKQGARIEQIEEMIRIAKLQARLKDNEYRHQQ